MKYDVFDVPLGLLREWSTGGIERYADNGRMMFVGVCLNHDQVRALDDGALLGRYIVVSSYGTFGDNRFGPVCSAGPDWFTLPSDALRYVDWAYGCDRDVLHDAVLYAGHDYEVWHVVGDGSRVGDLAPELPAMAFEVLRQLREAGELGDPDDLTDEDFVSTPCRTEDLPLAVVTHAEPSLGVLGEFLEDVIPDWIHDPDPDDEDSDELDIDELMWRDGYFEHPVCDDVPKHGRWYPPKPTDDELDFSFLDDDYWDVRPAPAPVNTWHEIDIQSSATGVLSRES